MKVIGATLILAAALATNLADPEQGLDRSDPTVS